MKKLLVFLMVAGLVIASSSLAQALSWQTTPVLGTSTYYSGGDVYVVTDTGLVNIPHNNPPYGPGDPFYGPGASMSVFYVGQTVDTGSGFYFDNPRDTYHLTQEYTGPRGLVTNYPSGYDYVGSVDGFVMWYLEPVSTLAIADVGTWHYSETWTNTTRTESPITYGTDFEVRGVPEPATMLLLGLGLVGLAGFARKRCRKN